MSQKASKPAILLLQDGTIFHGRSVGLDGTATGEICFNTGMTGYQEIFTDPSYYGQLMVTATAHIGNYGVRKSEVESESIKISGLICKNFSRYASRYQHDGSLYDYFKAQNKVVIADVDTRALVQHIRDAGAMNAIISTEITQVDELKKKLSEVPSMEGLELSSRVSTAQPYEMGNGGTYRVAALDLGIKKSILTNLAERGCHVKVFPMNAPMEQLNEFRPDGFFLSNGPGDPAAMPQEVKDTVKAIIESGKPVFGICLGHQMIALAMGLKTFKMHNGHRGINHPVINLVTGKGEITSQNHGFVVSEETVEAHAELELTHRHLNDRTVAGFRLKGKPVFSVQYHPEASPGPHDSRYLFDQFVSDLKQHKTA